MTRASKLALALAVAHLDRILAGEACVAKAARRTAVEGIQTLPAQIAQRIGADELTDLLDRLMGGEQFLAVGRVDSVKA